VVLVAPEVDLVDLEVVRVDLAAAADLVVLVPAELVAQAELATVNRVAQRDLPAMSNRLKI